MKCKTCYIIITYLGTINCLLGITIYTSFCKCDKNNIHCTNFNHILSRIPYITCILIFYVAKNKLSCKFINILNHCKSSGHLFKYIKSVY